MVKSGFISKLTKSQILMYLEEDKRKAYNDNDADLYCYLSHLLLEFREGIKRDCLKKKKYFTKVT